MAFNVTCAKVNLREVVLANYVRCLAILLQPNPERNMVPIHDNDPRIDSPHIP